VGSEIEHEDSSEKEGSNSNAAELVIQGPITPPVFATINDVMY